MNDQNSSPKDFPDEVKSRLNCWHNFYRRTNVTHYIVGILGVAASALAAVHIGARVMSKAKAGEVLVSSTLKEAVAGSDIQFENRGAHQLKGIPGEWHLFAVEC